MRDIQHSSVTKDLQHYEMIEKLKEEMRIADGKLRLYSEESNLEYLRNVFVQLISCEADNWQARKHILKAIGSVLKLSNKELQAIDKRF